MTYHLLTISCPNTAPLQYEFQPDEMDKYSEILQLKFDLWPHRAFGILGELSEKGKDDVLQVLLLALCPRLKSLKLVRSGHLLQVLPCARTCD